MRWKRRELSLINNKVCVCTISIHASIYSLIGQNELTYHYVMTPQVSIGIIGCICFVCMFLFAGNVYLKQNKFMESIECYTKAIKINVKNPTYYCNR